MSETRRLCFLLCAVAFAVAPTFGGLQVQYIPGAKPEWISEIDSYGIREEMEGCAADICRAYTDGSVAPLDGRTVQFRLYEGGGVAGTGGTQVSLSMSWHYDLEETRGALVHEMGHAVQNIVSDWLGGRIDLDQTIVLDNGEIQSLTEGLAEWVRRYCLASARQVRDREYDLMVGKEFSFDHYGDGAGLIEYLRRAYGPGILKDLLCYCSTNRGYKVDTMWPALTGRTYAQVIDDWKREDRITDPVLQWTYDGTADGIRRSSRAKCPFAFRSFSAEDQFPGSSRAAQATLGSGIANGNWTVAMRGKFYPAATDEASIIFAVGNTTVADSSLFVMAASRSGIAAAKVDAGSSASESAISGSPSTVSSDSSVYHTIVAVKSGASVSVYVDGTASPVQIALGDGALSNYIRIGAIYGGQNTTAPLYATSKWRAIPSDDVLHYQDFRMFDRALGAEELQLYFDAFPASYNPTAAVSARWIGSGGGSLASPENWDCTSAHGETISSVPSAGTDVVVWGRTAPHVPQGKSLACRSFTVKRWMSLDSDTDWRGLSCPVTLDPDAAIRTGGYTLTAGAVTGTTARVYGHLAYGSLKLTGDLILCGGCTLEMPAFNSTSTTRIGGRLLLQDDAPTFIKLAGGAPANGTYTVLTAAGGLPDDLSMLCLDGLSGRRTCTFSKDGNKLKATIAHADFCLWTGASGDGKFSTAGNWADGAKPTVGGNERIVFAATSDETVKNDIGNLTPAAIEFTRDCAALTVSGMKFTLPSGAAIERKSGAMPVFTAPVAFVDSVHTIGDVRFAGGVTAPNIHPGQACLFGHYTLTCSGEWAPEGLYSVQDGSSLVVDRYLANYSEGGSTGIAVMVGGAVTTRVAKVAYGRDLVMLNDGTFTVTEKLTNVSGGRLACYSNFPGQFFLNSVETSSSGGFEFNPSDIAWNDIRAVTNSENIVVGPGGINFPPSKDGGDIYVWYDRGIVLGSMADWTLGERNEGDTIWHSLRSAGESGYVRFCFNTADCFAPQTKHTVTLKGMISGNNTSVVVYGGGTARFACAATGQFKGGLYILGASTLEYATASTRAGAGGVYLEPGSTLALPAAGSGTVSVAGKLAFTNGVGTVNVRLGAADAEVQVGTYPIVEATGGVSDAFVSRLRLVNPLPHDGRGSFSRSGNTIVLVVDRVIPSGASCWTGDAGGSNGWNVSGNWRGGLLPQAGQRAYFWVGLVNDGNVLFKNRAVHSGDLQIDAGSPQAPIAFAASGASYGLDLDGNMLSIGKWTTGSLQIDSGLYRCGKASVGDGKAGYLTMTGGALEMTPGKDGHFYIGSDGNAGGVSEVKVGGSARLVSGRSLVIGDKSCGSLTVEGNAYVAATNTANGTVCTMLSYHTDGTSDQVCSLNLNGGVMETPFVTHGSGTARSFVSFDGGTLRASKDGELIKANDLLTVTLQANGGTVDTAGHDVTLPQPLAGSGTLAKTGAGTLTLTQSRPSASKTTLAEGTLTMSGSGTTLDWSKLTLGTDPAKPVTVRFENGAAPSNLSAEYNFGNVANITSTICKAGGEWTFGGIARFGRAVGAATSFVHEGGTLNFGNYTTVGGSSGALPATMVVKGGTVNATYYSSGTPDNVVFNVGASSDGRLVVTNGGTLNVTRCGLLVCLNNGADGTVEIADGGTVNLNTGLSFGWSTNTSDPGAGAVNLRTGGTLATKLVRVKATRGTSAFTLNFDGGTLKATNTTTTLIQASDRLTVNVSANGGTIDNAGNNITIAQGLSGTGTINLTGSGTTTFAAGVGAEGGVSVASGTTLTLNGASKTSGFGSLTLAAGSTLHLAGYAADVAPVAVGGTLTAANPVNVTFGSGAALSVGRYVVATANTFAGGAGSFALANALAEGTEAQFAVEGKALVLTVAKTVFRESDVVGLANNARHTLSAGQASWLNSLGARADVEQSLLGVDAEGFVGANLLNLDITKQGWNTWSFKATSTSAADAGGGKTEVVIAVTLTRAHAVQQGGRDAPINGVLKLYAVDLATKKESLVANAEITNETFAGGTVATFTVVTPAAGGVYRAKIEATP